MGELSIEDIRRLFTFLGYCDHSGDRPGHQIPYGGEKLPLCPKCGTCEGSRQERLPITDWRITGELLKRGLANFDIKVEVKLRDAVMSDSPNINVALVILKALASVCREYQTVQKVQAVQWDGSVAHAEFICKVVFPQLNVISLPTLGQSFRVVIGHATSEVLPHAYIVFDPAVKQFSKMSPKEFESKYTEV